MYVCKDQCCCRGIDIGRGVDTPPPSEGWGTQYQIPQVNLVTCEGAGPITLILTLLYPPDEN